MSRKRWGIVAVVLLAGIAVSVGAMWWAVRQVPDFYEAALEVKVDPVVRREEAREFIERAEQLVERIQQSDEWSEEFTQEQINSWLAEELQRNYSEVIPEGIEDPRVQLIDDAALVGFRYRQDSWKGVVSAHVRAWVSGPNQLAIQVDFAHAGLLPIPINTALDQVIKYVQDDRWRVEWDQESDEDVLLVSFEGEEAERGILESLELEPGVVRIRGRHESEAAQPERSLDTGE